VFSVKCRADAEETVDDLEIIETLFSVKCRADAEETVDDLEIIETLFSVKYQLTPKKYGKSKNEQPSLCSVRKN
jgi:hypothetical protein